MTPARIDLPVLIGQTGPLNGQRWLLEKALVIGRDPGCDLVINDRQVSRYHARIEPISEGVILEDLGSKNGTFVNGKRIEDPQVLEDSDLVQIALIQHFLYLVSDATMPLDTEALPTSSLPAAMPNQPVSQARLYLGPNSRRVWVKGQEIVPPLSLQQFRLLETLKRHSGVVVTRQELIDEVWGEEEADGVSEQAFDALVRRLRERISQLDPEANYIVTVRGHGLRLDNPDERPEG